jgi:pyruvate dehydrogenase E1 component
VINCNLQRLDGPVRGNGKIIQELEAAFRGAGWNVIKVIWGRRLGPAAGPGRKRPAGQTDGGGPDGQYQMYSVAGGAYIRKDFFGKVPGTGAWCANTPTSSCRKLRRGGHDPQKVYAAYQAAVQHQGAPTVILAKTIKGYGLGEAGEGRNITHQQKKLNEEELRHFRSRFGIPIPDDGQIAETPFYRPRRTAKRSATSGTRRGLGGICRRAAFGAHFSPAGPRTCMTSFSKGSGDREVATTMAMVHLLASCSRTRNLGKYIVPIVPDEARTFGMEACSANRHLLPCGPALRTGGQEQPALLQGGHRRPDPGRGHHRGRGHVLVYRRRHGLLHLRHQHDSLFLFFYSMFGFQRIGDLIWAAGDIQARGFLLGATAGRTTLAGEGCSTRTATATSWPWPTLRCWPTIRPLPTKSP